MSKTMLVLLIAIGVGVAVSRKESAGAASAATTSGTTEPAEAVDTTPAKPTILGKIGVRLAEGTVVRMSTRTQYILQTLGPDLKRATGMNARRANDAAKSAREMDKASLEALKQAHPIDAIRAAIDARNYANLTKGILNGP